MTYVTHSTKNFPGGYTTATALKSLAGTYRVTVMVRFDSGNYLKEYEKDNLSLVAAEGLLAYYTR